MFEGSQQAYTGMLQGLHARAADNVSHLSSEVIRLKRKTVDMGAERDALQVENADLRARLDEMDRVRQAENEALAAVTAEWRKVHPVSVLHDFVGKFRDGEGMRRNVAIWIGAFDAAARRLGIRSPEAWRIS